MPWCRREGRGSLLYKEDIHCSRSCIDHYVSVNVWTYLSNHLFWRYGAGKRKTLYFHGNMYHDRKTNRVDYGIYSAIWFQGSRRCQVYNDNIHVMYVALQSSTCDGTCKSVPYGTNCSMDRNVYRLDDQSNYLYGTI